MLIAALCSFVLAAQEPHPTVVALQEPGRVPVDTLRATFIYDVRDFVEALVPLRTVDEAQDARRQFESRIVRVLRNQLTPQPDEPVGALDSVLERSLEREPLLQRESRDLAAFLAKFVDPPLAKGLDELQSVAAGSLVLVGSKEQGAWVEEFFARQRSFGELIQLEVRFLEAPRGALEERGLSMSEVAEAGTERTELERKLADLPVLQAPRLTLRPSSAADIKVVNQVQYVKEFEVAFVEPGPTAIADPVIDSVDDGVSTRARIAPLGEQLFALSLEVSRSELKRPMKTKKVRVGPGGLECEVGLPEVTRARFAADLRVAEGALVALTTGFDEQRDLMVLVSVRRAPASAPVPTEGK